MKKTAQEIYRNVHARHCVPGGNADSYDLEAMEEYADQYKSKWQSTDDGYPHVENDYDFSDPVLICHNIDKWNARGVYQHGAWYNDFDTENECFPTHWMPIPELPE